MRIMYLSIRVRFKVQIVIHTHQIKSRSRKNNIPFSPSPSAFKFPIYVLYSKYYDCMIIAVYDNHSPSSRRSQLFNNNVSTIDSLHETLQISLLDRSYTLYGNHSSAFLSKQLVREFHRPTEYNVM